MPERGHLGAGGAGGTPALRVVSAGLEGSVRPPKIRYWVSLNS